LIILLFLHELEKPEMIKIAQTERQTKGAVNNIECTTFKIN